ncbi:hypothetical protein B7494_g5876 [Chlorociboria aeruginascens]|nr:hypothetical protein B7494_g5876 [Chlorociboria aeruginascens]
MSQSMSAVSCTECNKKIKPSNAGKEENRRSRNITNGESRKISGLNTDPKRMYCKNCKYDMAMITFGRLWTQMISRRTKQGKMLKEKATSSKSASLPQSKDNVLTSPKAVQEARIEGKGGVPASRSSIMEEAEAIKAGAMSNVNAAVRVTETKASPSEKDEGGPSERAHIAGRQAKVENPEKLMAKAAMVEKVRAARGEVKVKIDEASLDVKAKVDGDNKSKAKVTEENIEGSLGTVARLEEPADEEIMVRGDKTAKGKAGTKIVVETYTAEQKITMKKSVSRNVGNPAADPTKKAVATAKSEGKEEAAKKERASTEVLAFKV